MRARPRAGTVPRGVAVRRRGFTLMEMLVALVIVSLLGALLVQGIGLLASRFDEVQRIHRQGARTALPQSWFAASVQGLVPHGVDARRMRGGASAFEGVTLRPLRGDPAVPAVARWSVDGQSVFYAEGVGNVGGEPWRVYTAAGRGALTFEYEDSAGVWHGRWPLAEDAPERVPRSVRLVAADAGTLLLAHVPAWPLPIHTEETMR